MQDENELQDSLTPEDETQGLDTLAPEEEEEETTPDQAEVDPKKLEKLKATNLKLYKRAKRSEEVRKAAEEKLEALKKTLEPEEEKEEGEETAFDTFVKHASLIQGMSPEEIQDLKKQAGELGTTPESLAGSPVFKTHLELQRTKAKKEKSTPDPSTRSPKVEGKTFETMDKSERSKSFGPKAWIDRKRSN